MNRKWINITIALMCAMTANAETNTPSPIKISADNVVVDQKSLSSVYSGNVQLDQGPLHLSADELTVFTANKRLEHLEANGSPARLNMLDSEGVEISGQALQIDYFARANEVVLIGNAKLLQADNTVESETIRYDLNQGRLKAGGEQTGDRVEVILLPVE